MDAISAIARLAVGACLGSFLNVVALRFISGEDIVKKPSHCTHCQRRLAWWELIPLISFVSLRARCRTCHQSISIQYPIVELLTAVSTLVIFSAPIAPGIPLVSAILSLVIVCLLLILAVIDARTMILPDIFIGLLTAAVILQLLVARNFPITHLLGAAAITGFLSLLWILTNKRGIGLGDVKIGAPLGLLVGWPGIVSLILVAFMAGGTWGMYLLATKQATRKTAVPFGPFLAGAALLFILWPTGPAVILELLGWP